MEPGIDPVVPILAATPAETNSICPARGVYSAIVLRVAQNHFDPDSYPEFVRSEIPVYDELEDVVAEAAAAPAAKRILDLGAGTGETAKRVLERQPGAVFVLVDSSAEMLDAARENLPEASVEQILEQRLEDPLPPAPFDLVVSALAVHHLESADKQALFLRVSELLEPGGRFVLADVFVPVDPELAATPVSSPFDRPDRLDDQLNWLGAAGFETSVVWTDGDLAVVVAEKS